MVEATDDLGNAADLTLKKSFDGEQELANCGPAEIVSGQSDGVHTISFFLNEEQLEVYQERLDAIQAFRDKHGLDNIDQGDGQI